MSDKGLVLVEEIMMPAKAREPKWVSQVRTNNEVNEFFAPLDKKVRMLVDSYDWLQMDFEEQSFLLSEFDVIITTFQQA